MKKTSSRQLVSLPLAASPAARQLVDHVRDLDLDALRVVVAGGAYERQRNIIG